MKKLFLFLLLLASPLYASVTPTGLVSDGVTDNHDAFQTAINTAISTNDSLLIPKGNYFIGNYLLVENADGLKISADGRARLIYNCVNPAAVTDAKSLSLGSSRSIFYVLNSNNVTVSNIVGYSQDYGNVLDSYGCLIYARNSRYITVENCRANGAPLFHQDIEPNDIGARILNCVTINSRANSNCGSQALFKGCRFELVDDTTYDRVDATHGSSHAIYIYAGRRNVTIEDCFFIGIRTSGVKISGSSLPISDIRVLNCHFINCGNAITVGADDVQEHSNILISGNSFTNCSLNRQGWNDGDVVYVLGVNGCVISNNTFYSNRANAYEAGVASIHYIRIGEYVANQNHSPVIGVVVKENTFLGVGINVGQIATYGIEVNPATGPVRIEDNNFIACAALGIQIVDSNRVEIFGNSFTNLISAIYAFRSQLITGFNRLYRGNYTSNNGQYRIAPTCTHQSFGNVGF